MGCSAVAVVEKNRVKFAGINANMIPAPIIVARVGFSGNETAVEIDEATPCPSENIGNSDEAAKKPPPMGSCSKARLYLRESRVVNAGRQNCPRARRTQIC